MSDIVVNLVVNSQGFNVQIQNAERTLASLGRSLGLVNAASSQANKGMNSIVGTLRDISIIGYTVSGAFQTMKSAIIDWQMDIIKSAAQLEKMTVLLSGLSKEQTQFGKNREAHQNLQSMIELAQQMPFAMDKLTSSFVKFKAVNLADPERMVKALANAVAAFGGSEDELHRASVAIMQMSGKGVISMEELRQQLGEAVPSAIKVMARELGMSYSELVKKISQGKVQAAEGIDAMMRGFEKDFSGAGERMMGTWNGMLSQLKTQWVVFNNEIARGGLFDSAKLALKGLIELLKDPEFVRFGVDFGASLGKALDNFRNLAKAMIEHREQLGMAVNAGKMFLAIWLGEKGLSLVIGLFRSLSTAALLVTGPIGLIAKLIAAGAVGWAAFSDHVDDSGQKVNLFTDVSQELEGVAKSDTWANWRVFFQRLGQDVDNLANKSFDNLNEKVKESGGYFSELAERIKNTNNESDTWKNHAKEMILQYGDSSFVDRLKASFDILISETLVQLSAYFVKEFPKDLDASAYDFERYANYLSEKLTNLASVADMVIENVKAVFTFDFSKVSTPEQMWAALSDGFNQTERDILRAKADLVQLQYEMQKTVNVVSDMTNKTNSLFAQATAEREKLIKRYNETGGIYTEADRVNIENYKKTLEELTKQYQQNVDELQTLESDRQNILDDSAKKQIAIVKSLNAQLRVLEQQRKVNETSLAGIANNEELDKTIEGLKSKLVAAQQELNKIFSGAGTLSEQDKAKVAMLDAQIVRLRATINSLGGSLDGLYEIQEKVSNTPIVNKETESQIRSTQTLIESLQETMEGVWKDEAASQPGAKALADLEAAEQKLVKYMTDLEKAKDALDLFRSGFVTMTEDEARVIEDSIGRQDEVIQGQLRIIETKKEAWEKAVRSAQTAANAEEDLYQKQLQLEASGDGLIQKLKQLVPQFDELTNAAKRGSKGLGEVVTTTTRTISSSVNTTIKGMESLSSAYGTRIQAVGTVGALVIKKQSAEVQSAIDAAEKKYNLQKGILEAIKTRESQDSTNISITNPKSKAYGLFQFMPATMDYFKKRFNSDFTTIKGQADAAGQYVAIAAEKAGGNVTNIFAKYVGGFGKTLSTSTQYGKDYANQTTTIFNTLSGGLSSVTTTADQANEGLLQVKDTTVSLAQSSKEINLEGVTDPLKQFRDDMAAYETNIAELQPLLEQYYGWESKIAEVGTLNNEQHIAYSNTIKELTPRIDALTKQKAALVEQDQAQVESGAKLVEEMKKTPQELKAMSDSYGTAESATRKYNMAVSDLITLYRSGAIKTLDEFKEKVREAALTMESAQGSWGKWLADKEKEIGTLDDFMGNVMDSFTDTIADGLADGKLDFESFVTDVKKMLAKIAVNTIMVKIVSALTGTDTGSSAVQIATNALTGGSGTGTGGLSSLSSLSSLSKLSSLFTGNSMGAFAGSTLAKLAGSVGYSSYGLGNSVASLASTTNAQYGIASILGSLAGNAIFNGKGYSSIGSGIGSTAGAMIGTAIGGGSSIAAGAAMGSIIPGIGTIIGAIIGGIAGGGLGSLFGNKKPSFGGYATSFSGQGFEDNVSSKGGFGLNFGINDKGSRNIDASKYKDALDGLASVSNTMADFFGTDISNTVQAGLQKTLGDFNDWGDNFDENFRQIFGTITNLADDAIPGADDKASLFAHTIDLLGGVFSTSGASSQDMAKKIQDAMDITSTTMSLYDTEIGKMIGMGKNLQFGSLTSSLDGLVKYINEFRWASDQTAGETIQRMVGALGNLQQVMALTGTSVETLSTKFKATSDDIIHMALNITGAISKAGLSIDDFTSLMNSYYDNFYSEKEKAQKVYDASIKQIKDFNANIGNMSGELIDTKAELRSFIDSLIANGVVYSEEGAKILIEALKTQQAFLDLAAALETLGDEADKTTDKLSQEALDWIDSITPDDVKQSKAWKDISDQFAKWGIQIPRTTADLYELIAAGKLTNEQIEWLTKNSTEVGLAYQYLGTLQNDLIDQLKTKYDELKAAAQEASDAKIQKLRDESQARLDALEEAYNKQRDDLNEQIDKLNDSLDKYKSVVDDATSAWRTLLESTDGIDETRQRYLKEAQAAIDQITAGKGVPDNINDIISGLSSVNKEDFATKAAWEAAVKENEALLQKLKDAAGTQKDKTQQQIDLLQAQLDQAEKQYNDAVAQEKANLDTAIAAEEDRLKRELADLDAQFATEKGAIMQASVDQLLELAKQTDLLAAIKELIASGKLDGGDGTADQKQAKTTYNGLDAKKQDDTWSYFMKLLSNDGAKKVDLPDLNADNKYDNLVKFLLYSKDHGVFDGTDYEDIKKWLADLGVVIPGFAAGGSHLGGLRIVGENGPELEYTGPSYVTSASKTKDLLSQSDLIKEVQELRRELRESNSILTANAAKSYKMMDRWEQIGMPQMRSDIYTTPYSVQVV